MVDPFSHASAQTMISDAAVNVHGRDEQTSNIVTTRPNAGLVILDEIGRGTSTFDGLSIAWSVAEFLHDKIKARSSRHALS